MRVVVPFGATTTVEELKEMAMGDIGPEPPPPLHPVNDNATSGPTIAGRSSGNLTNLIFILGQTGDD